MDRAATAGPLCSHCGAIFRRTLEPLLRFVGVAPCWTSVPRPPACKIAESNGSERESGHDSPAAEGASHPKEKEAVAASLGEDAMVGSVHHDVPVSLCAACLGLLPTAMDHGRAAVETLRASPYLHDVQQVTPTVSFPRLLKLWYEVAAWQLLEESLRRGRRGGGDDHVAPSGSSDHEAVLKRWQSLYGLTSIPSELSLREAWLTDIRSALVASLPLGVAVTTQSEDVLVERVIDIETTPALQRQYQLLPQSYVSRDQLSWDQAAAVSARLGVDIFGFHHESKAAMTTATIESTVPIAAAVSPPPTHSKMKLVVKGSITRAAVFIVGRYRKFLHDVAQSPWFVNGQRVGSLSLQERIGNVVLPYLFPNGLPETANLPNLSSARTVGAKTVRGWDGQVAADDVGSGKPASSSSAPGRHRVNAHLDLAAHRQNSNAGDEERQPRGNSGDAGQDAESGDEDAAAAVVSSTVTPYEANVQRVYGFRFYKMSSSGREDVDVRMLGKGRPFLLEVATPHARARLTKEDFRAMEQQINDGPVDLGIEVSDLGFTDKAATTRMARDSESKRKVYRCVVWCSRPLLSSNDPHLVRLNELKDLTIVQKTPLRVLHRRTLMERHRVIHALRAERINAHWLLVDLETSSGTYVKEFIHGDMGRTVPHFGMLLRGTTDIIQLDVLDLLENDGAPPTDNSV